MTCNNRTTGSSNDEFFAQQEHRQVSRLWKKAIQKLSSSRTDLADEFEDVDGGRRNVRFNKSSGQLEPELPCDDDEKKFPSEAIQRKLLKGKSSPKARSPLQRFDEIVTKELTSRRVSEEAGRMPSFEGCKKWSSYSGRSEKSETSSCKVTAENKVSRGALYGVEKEVKEFDPSDAEHAALMDAIEKLAQAQAFCRFDAAVKAAEAATASVPLEMAEEVAVACAKDYQSEIVDVINEKIPLSEERKPVEVIGYIGVTKLKDNL